jgi:PAS domain S-box-containing protein
METARAIVADPGRTPPPLTSPVRAPAVPSGVELAWSLLNASREAILLSDRDGEVLVVNDSAAELFGEADADLAGRDLDDLVPGLEAEARERTGHPSEPAFTLDAQMAHADPIAVEVRVNWIQTDEGRVLAAFLRRA